MNVEIGTEAAQFPEKEYKNGIFIEVYPTLDAVRLKSVAIIKSKIGQVPF